MPIIRKVDPRLNTSKLKRNSRLELFGRQPTALLPNEGRPPAAAAAILIALLVLD
jgi:hypothetical protein